MRTGTWAQFGELNGAMTKNKNEAADEAVSEAADDSAAGVLEKLAILEPYKIHVLAPGLRGLHAKNLTSLMQQAIDNVIRLDMAPNDFGLLQRKGILTVLGYDLIERHNEVHRPGTVILYYRDRPDFDPRDNLMNKLKYAVDHRRMN